ncbi:MAG: hypothetical protein J3Q66DRAFT_323508 [Benniella sp.]|nr:MAG: hypothetical protein J3Q66DRAFT_323508 [Benniella sp.]
MWYTARTEWTYGFFQPLLSSRFFAANVFITLCLSQHLLSLFFTWPGGKGVKVWNLEWCFGGTQTVFNCIV